MHGKIKNFKELATTKEREIVLEIAEAGLRAIDTDTIIRKEVSANKEYIKIHGKKIAFKDIERLIVIGVGKCSHRAAQTLEEILGSHIISGVVVDVEQGAPLKKIISYKGTHPMPSAIDEQAAAHIVKSLQGLTEHDLVLFIISGGGSTLLCLPKKGGYKQEAEILHELMAKGAPIQDINIVRKHLSLARGGRLAEDAYPAKCISLIFSDVPRDNIQFIASGPTVKDKTNVHDARVVLKKYNIPIPEGLMETPKNEKYFKNVENVVVMSNKNALEAMLAKAKALGFNAKIAETHMTGEARDVSERVIKELAKEKPKTIVLYGGETTVTIKGSGKGGRNQEFALSGLRSIKENEVVLALASDGRDNSDFAGAICDVEAKAHVNEKGLDIQKYLDDNDSYEFFRETGDGILTGHTQSNVSDLVIALTV